jgi:hypothetical protein
MAEMTVVRAKDPTGVVEVVDTKPPDLVVIDARTSSLTNTVQTGQVLAGPPGLSAYEIWLAEGNVGTEQDYLASLKGDPGAPGIPGASVGGSYHHVQGSVSDTWVIPHGLGFNPSVTVHDSAGAECVGDVTYDSFNQLTIRFSAAFSGVADLS